MAKSTGSKTSDIIGDPETLALKDSPSLLSMESHEGMVCFLIFASKSLNNIFFKLALPCKDYVTIE